MASAVYWYVKATHYYHSTHCNIYARVSARCLVKHRNWLCTSFLATPFAQFMLACSDCCCLPCSLCEHHSNIAALTSNA